MSAIPEGTSSLPEGGRPPDGCRPEIISELIRGRKAVIIECPKIPLRARPTRQRLVAYVSDDGRGQEFRPTGRLSDEPRQGKSYPPCARVIRYRTDLTAGS